MGKTYYNLNQWFKDNANEFTKPEKPKLYTEEEVKRLCYKITKEAIESVRNNDFHFKNMTNEEVVDYLLK